MILQRGIFRHTCTLMYNFVCSTSLLLSDAEMVVKSMLVHLCKGYLVNQDSNGNQKHT